MKGEKFKIGFKKAVDICDELFVKANEVSSICYFFVAFMYLLLFLVPETFIASVGLRVATEIFHGLITVIFVLCTIFKYRPKARYWISSVVLLVRYVGLIDIAGSWHKVVNPFIIGVIALYYIFFTATWVATKVNADGSAIDTALLAFGVFWTLLWVAFFFDHKWMFVVGVGSIYLYAIARVFKSVFYGKKKKELDLVQIIGNSIFYIAIIVGLPFFLCYAGVGQDVVNDTIIPIYAASVGGLMTLAGVAWTIRKGDEDRQQDKEQMEASRKEEERKKLVPYTKIMAGRVEKASVCADIPLKSTISLDELEKAEKLTTQEFYGIEIAPIAIKNISTSNYLVCGIDINGNKYSLKNKTILEQNGICVLRVSGYEKVYVENLIDTLSLEIEDVLGHRYKLHCDFEWNRIPAELVKNSSTKQQVVIYCREYKVVNISIPTLMEDTNE